jgi:hypothetical protein
LGHLPVPTEYPSKEHLRLHELVTGFAAGAQRPEDYLTEFRAGLSGLVHRYTACSASCRALVASEARDRVTYDQDRDFFGFVVNGLAAMDTFSYAAYAAGATFWPHLFPFASEAARRAVGPRSTARAYDLAGEAEFAALFNTILDSQDHRAWRKYHTVLSHRAGGTTGFHAAANTEGAHASVQGMQQWLDETLAVLLAGLVAVAERQRAPQGGR